MIPVIVGLIFATGLYPLAQAWRANRRTTLFQAVHWAAAAWAAWGCALTGPGWLAEPLLPVARYLALCVTGCAGVAVLGARRPGVRPWIFVLVGLLVVMLLPLAEGTIAGGAMHLEGARTLILPAATLAMIVVNYLPTRLGTAAILLALGGAIQLLMISQGQEWGKRNPALDPASGLLLGFVPWAAFERMRSRPLPASEFDRVWLGFRDGFGLVWGQRVREQFNNSAAHAGWPALLRWQGLRILPGAVIPPPELQREMLGVLHSLLKRFRWDEDVL